MKLAPRWTSEATNTADRWKQSFSALVGNAFRRKDASLSIQVPAVLAESEKTQRIVLDCETKPKRRNGGAANPHLRSILASGTERYVEHLRYLTGIREEFYQIPDAPDPLDPLLPNWENGFLPGLDIVSLHGFLRRYNPKRYVEIGSGNSTKVARRAINMHCLQTSITSIDPHPRSDIDKICDRVVRTGIEDVDLTEMASLEAGDIFFLDGSHRAYMNSDVTVFFLEILPILKPGVLVQIHDICLPYDYPGEWRDRCYSEQYLLGCALLYGSDRFRIELPGAFVSYDAALSREFADLWNDSHLRNAREKHGASFWFSIPGTPVGLDTPG